MPRGIISGTLIQGASEVKLSKANQIIKDAEDAAFKAQTGADFGFNKLANPDGWDSAIQNANGDGEGIGRKINCQRCVVAAEARMRGYDVIARMSWGVGDPMLKIPEWLKVFETDKLDIKEFTGKNTEAAINSAKEIMKSFGTGARAFIWFNWENTPNLWHVIVAECRGDSVVVFGDPQRRVVAASKYFDEANLKSLKIMRVDNINFTDNVKRCCVNKE